MELNRRLSRFLRTAMKICPLSGQHCKVRYTVWYASGLIILHMLTVFKEQMEGIVDDEPGQKDHKEMLGTLLQFV